MNFRFGLHARFLALVSVALLTSAIVLGILLHRQWELLTGYQPTVNSALYALYLPNRYMTAKVHCFLDLLRESFSELPYWDAR